MKTDVAIIGAGTAGLAAGLFLAEKGLRVEILEKEGPKGFGNSWINETDTGSYRAFGLPEPTGDELAFDEVRNVRMKTSEEKDCFVLSGMRNYSVKVSAYQERLCSLAREKGVRLRFSTEARELLYEDGRVAGVLARDLEKNRRLTLNSPMTFLACGALAPILKTLPRFSGFDLATHPADKVFAIQEVWEIDRQKASDLVAGGFLHDNELVAYCALPGAGPFSTFLYQLDIRRGIIGILSGTKSHLSGVVSPRAVLDQWMAKTGVCRKKAYGGGRMIPLRPSLDSLVENGVAVVGDAARTACPANGSGTTPSMVSAVLCAQAASRALLDGRAPSLKDLWQANHAYMTGLGSVFAGYYAAQRLFSGLTEQEVQAFLRHGMISEKDFHAVHDTRPVSIGFADGLSRLAKGLPVLPLLARLARRAVTIERISRHYKQYPETWSPSAFASWQEKKRRILSAL